MVLLECMKYRLCQIPDSIAEAAVNTQSCGLTPVTLYKHMFVQPETSQGNLRESFDVTSSHNRLSPRGIPEEHIVVDLHVTASVTEDLPLYDRHPRQNKATLWSKLVDDQEVGIVDRATEWGN